MPGLKPSGMEWSELEDPGAGSHSATKGGLMWSTAVMNCCYCLLLVFMAGAVAFGFVIAAGCATPTIICYAPQKHFWWKCNLSPFLSLK